MADKFDLKAIISAVDKMTPTLKGIQRSVKLTSKTINDIGRAGRQLTTSLGLPAGIAFGAVTYGAIRAARASLEFAGSIQDAAERSGGSVENYQALVNMLGAVGGSAEDAEKSVMIFNKGAAAAAAGADKSFAGLMKKLNIPLKDAQGNIRGIASVLPELADGFAKNTNPAIRTRMATELFGKSGTKLIPILAKGRASVEAWIKEQQRLGLIVSTESVGAVDDLGDSIQQVNTQIKAQLTTSLAKLVPVLQPLIKNMTEWIGANKELIQQRVADTVKSIAQWVQRTDWGKVASDINGAFTAISNVVSAMGGIKNVIYAIGIAFAAGPISSILGIIGALWRFGAGLLSIVGGWSAVGAAIMRVIGIGRSLIGIIPLIGRAFMLVGRAFLLNPIGLVLTAIAAAAYLVYKNWDTIKTWFSQFFSWMQQKVNAIAKWFSSLVPDWMKNMFAGGGSVKVSQSAMPTPLARSGAIQAGAGQQRLTGDMTVRFENAPAGMRVDPGKTNQPGVSMNPDVGYRSLAMAGVRG